MVVRTFGVQACDGGEEFWPSGMYMVVRALDLSVCTWRWPPGWRGTSRCASGPGPVLGLAAVAADAGNSASGCMRLAPHPSGPRNWIDVHRTRHMSNVCASDDGRAFM
eukprot:357907-Chlamydomonas_euryale.AAC.5